MAFRRLRSILLPALLLVLLFTGSVLLLHSVIHQPSVQDYLLRQLSDRIGVEIHADEMQVVFWKGVGIEARNMRIGTSGGARALTASRIYITLSLSELIRGRVAPTGLVLEEPVMDLGLPVGQGSSAMEGSAISVDKSPLGPLAMFPSVTLERALITIKGMPLRGTGLFVRLSRVSQDPLRFGGTLSGKVAYKGHEFPLSASGDIAWEAATGLQAGLDVKAAGIPLSPVQLPDLPVKKGHADVEATVVGGAKGISAKGNVRLSHLDFAILDKGDRKDFAFEELSVPFDATYVNDEVHIPSFQVKGPGFILDGTARLALRDLSNHHLNLSVKSDAMALETFRRIFPSSLLPSWVETQLFPIFSGGRVRVDQFSLNGGIRQIADLDMAKNADALRLQLTCTDLTAFKGEEGIPVNGLSGVMSIENGVVRASAIRCRFGESRIEEGSLRVSSLYDQEPSIDVTAAGSARMEDLLRQKGLSLVPEEVRSHLEWFSSATGEVQGKVEVGYEREWPSPRLLKGDLSFKECTLDSAWLVFPVFVKEGRLMVDGEEKRRFSARGRWGRSWVDASGTLGPSWETGDARVRAQLDLSELIGHFRPDLHSRLFFKRPVTCGLNLVKRENSWRFQGDVDLKEISLETGWMTVEPFAADGGLVLRGEVNPGKRFSISNLRCSAGESAFELAGAWDWEGDGPFAFTVSGKKIRLEDLGVRFKKGGLMGRGTLALDAEVRGDRSMPDRITVIGEARGRDLFFAGEAFPHPVEQCSLDLRFDKTKIAVDSMELRFGRSRFHVKGSLQGWEGLRGDLTIESEDLDLTNLISPAVRDLFKATAAGADAATESHSVPDRRHEEILGFIARSDIHLDLKAQKGRWEGFTCGPLTMECALRSGDLYIARSSAAWEHGRIQLRGHIKRGPQPEMLFSGYLDMTRQPLTDLPEALDVIRSKADGLLTVEALLFAQGSEGKDLLSSLSGSSNLLLQEGVFKKSNLFIKILDFLSLEGKLERRPSHLPEGGLYFEDIGGHIELNGGIARTEDMTMRSPVFNAAARGEASLKTGQIEAEVGVHPFGTLDSLLNKVPVVGYLLTGDQKALYIEYFKVDGPLSDPNVQHIPLKSIGKGTTRLLTRLLLLPTRVFKRISDAAKEFEGKGYPLPGDVGGPEHDMGGLGTAGSEELRMKIEEGNED